jgi:hypothetical protein
MRQKSGPNQFSWCSLERYIIQLSVVRRGLRLYDGTSARISAVKKKQLRTMLAWKLALPARHPLGTLLS